MVKKGGQSVVSTPDVIPSKLENDEDEDETNIQIDENDNDDNNENIKPFELSSQVNTSIQHAKSIQKAKLLELKEKQKQLDANIAADNRSIRMNYLMQQSEVFSHFLSESDTSSSNISNSNSNKKNSTRTRMSEEEEDKQMMKLAATKSITSTRLLSQPPSITGGAMRSYQLEGLNWMIKLNDNNINGILADEMGLGKTLQTISLLAYLKENRNINDPHDHYIVIVPKSTVSNWMRECNRWCPSLNVIYYIHNRNIY
jgi:SWI/SNF-related matrix-associated actin-dependent regulator of chromatin subfamily A member 5